MRIVVKLFALAAQRAGTPTLTLNLTEPASVADLRQALAVASPTLAPLVPSLMIAVDRDYADDRYPLGPDSDVAAFPPVSGGGPGDSPLIRLTDIPIDHAELIETVRSDLAGAICVFLGTVREMTGDLRTLALDYQAYPEMALAKMVELDTEARRRWPIQGVALVHRLGHLELGEVCVGIAVSCPHRDQAFDACRWLIDTLKATVPIWKKEHWADRDPSWIHPGLATDPRPDQGQPTTIDDPRRPAPE